MLQITPQHRLFICIEPADFRRGIDGLAASCRNELDADPFSGCFFIFRNKRGTSIKVLVFDGNGFFLCQKRFSKGKVQRWPQTECEAKSLRAVDLLIMLQQGDPQAAAVPSDWRPLPT
jgi:transposase